MRRAWQAGLGLTLSVLLTAHARADDIQWRPATACPDAASAVTLGRPQPLLRTGFSQADGVPGGDTQAAAAAPHPDAFRPVVRAQSQDVAQGSLPPPPPPPPPPGPPAFPGSKEEGYNCGVANENPTTKHPILGGCWGAITGVPGAVTGIFQPAAGRAPFQSDNAFKVFSSPVTNPFYFEDPRSLTELRPVFIYQQAPNNTPIFHGGNIEFFGLQGRVAITDRFSLVMSKLGWIWTNIDEPTAGFHSDSGFSEIMLGPKYTLIRNDCSGTLLALGVFFDIPAGPHSVFQDTGTLSIAPYMSFGQNFLKSSYGSFNFLNTTGYSFSTDNERSEFFYSSFHLDFDVANLNKIYPLVEMNWMYYTTGGTSTLPVGFEGKDLINFGTIGVSGHDDLTIAFGVRYKFSECVQLGFAAEFPLTGQHDLLEFRLLFDMIFRY
jgi:hypothetical protein